ncbi:uncharacterized protein BDZ99DRAFT_513932 [Mytilinidion resinicola]|uniref:Uncharacterized protein n=1 Tax=Mytilinidion resinicola TaxID=574789 RepID=A0A6A6ZBV7_9PEZI|nr:uncharacterized protein BDZ99DRAFT_513932 [Mytilinidion resinicola]KAF2817707.1 hypothetical protein BDZ99DRAFT_513932 [Mytilinidion resinicola]
MARPQTRSSELEPSSTDPPQDVVLHDAGDMAPEFIEDVQESERQPTPTPSDPLGLRDTDRIPKGTSLSQDFAAEADEEDAQEGERQPTPTLSDIFGLQERKRPPTPIPGDYQDPLQFATEADGEDGGAALDRAPLNSSIIPLHLMESTQPRGRQWTLGEYIKRVSQGSKRPLSNVISNASPEERAVKRFRSKAELEAPAMEQPDGPTTEQPDYPTMEQADDPTTEQADDPAMEQPDDLAMEQPDDQPPSKEGLKAPAMERSGNQPPSDKTFTRPHLSRRPPDVNAAEMASTRLVEYARSGSSELPSSDKFPSRSAVQMTVRRLDAIENEARQSNFKGDRAIAVQSFLEGIECALSEWRMGFKSSRVATRPATPDSPLVSDDYVASLEKRHRELIDEMEEAKSNALGALDSEALERLKSNASERMKKSNDLQRGISRPQTAWGPANSSRPSSDLASPPSSLGSSLFAPSSTPQTAESPPPLIQNSDWSQGPPRHPLFTPSEVLGFLPADDPLVVALRNKPPDEEFYLNRWTVQEGATSRRGWDVPTPERRPEVMALESKSNPISIDRSGGGPGGAGYPPPPAGYGGGGEDLV